MTRRAANRSPSSSLVTTAKAACAAAHAQVAAVSNKRRRFARCGASDTVVAVVEGAAVGIWWNVVIVPPHTLAAQVSEVNVFSLFVITFFSNILSCFSPTSGEWGHRYVLRSSSNIQVSIVHVLNSARSRW